MGHLIAFTLSVLLALMNAPNDQSRSMEKKAVPDVEFAHSGAIEGLTADGFEFSTEGYKSSDGISLSVTRIRCQTAETAERLMTQTLDNAKSVIQLLTMQRVSFVEISSSMRTENRLAEE
jgi:hypothetical protein